MTDLLRVRSGGRDVHDNHQSSTASSSLPSHRTDHSATEWPGIEPVARRPRAEAGSGAPDLAKQPTEPHTPAGNEALTVSLVNDERPPFVDAAAVAILCLLALYVATAHGWSLEDDGAGVVPIIALVGIATAAIRRRPGRTGSPVRVVSVRLALLVGATGAGLVAITILDPEPPGPTIGPMLSLALIAAYLALWGFRSLALLRTVTLLSFLTWIPVAETVHSIVRSSLDQPSDLIYQRLATINAFGVDEEPWRLFTASLHRGSLVVITTVVLGIAASRWRVTPRTLIELAVSATVAVLAHHVIVLASSVDQYDPTDTTEVATNPVLEVAVAVVAVLILTVVRHRRDHDPEPIHVSDTVSDEVAARDPVIFATDRAVSGPVVTALLLIGLAPLITVAVRG